MLGLPGECGVRLKIMGREVLSTAQVWRWSLSLREPDAERMRFLRCEARKDPIHIRLALVALQCLVACSVFAPLIILGGRLPPQGVPAIELGVAYGIGFILWLVLSGAAGFALGAIAVAWVVRRYRIVSECSLEYLLRKGL